MLSTTIVCILISNIIFVRLTIGVNQCDLSSAINLQTATYSHSLILRVQPIDLSKQIYTETNFSTKKVFVREVIKIPQTIRRQHLVKMNDIVIIRINGENHKLLDDPCWHLLRTPTVNVILFLNETNTNEFNLYYPPVESTLHTRQHIDAVLTHGKYL